MAKIEISTVVNRPVEDVFAVMTDHEMAPKWNPTFVEVKKTSAGPVGRGTTWRRVVNFMGRRLESEVELTEFEPNRKFMLQGKQGPFLSKAQEILERVEGGTRVNLILEVEGHGLFIKLVEPILATLTKRQFEAALANFKNLMEAHAL